MCSLQIWSSCVECFTNPTFPMDTETNQCLPAESAGVIGLLDRFIRLNEYRLEGLSVQEIAALLRGIVEEKPGEPLRLRFRRHTSITPQATGEVFRPEDRNGDGNERPAKQKDLAAMSYSKHPNARNVVSTKSIGHGEYEAMITPGIGLHLKSDCNGIVVSGCRKDPGERLK